MTMSRRNRQWRDRRARDFYASEAQRAGWRSRAVFKLQSLDGKARLFRPGMRVLDLGAAPGGWSQYAAAKVAPGGRVVAVDLLDFAPLPGVCFVRGDAGDPAVLTRALERLGGRADLVMSDMAPNISGIASVDVPRSLALAETALAAAGEALGNGGVFVVKLFQGEGFDDYLAEVRRRAARVTMRKPKASRAESREIYVIAAIGGEQ